MNDPNHDLAEIKELLKALPGQLAAALGRPSMTGRDHLGRFGQGQTPVMPQRIVAGVMERPEPRVKIPQEKVMGNLIAALFPNVSKAADDFHNKNFPVYQREARPPAATPPPLPFMYRYQAQPAAPGAPAPAAQGLPEWMKPPPPPGAQNGLPNWMKPPAPPTPTAQGLPNWLKPVPPAGGQGLPNWMKPPAPAPVPAPSLAARLISIPKAIGGYAKGAISSVYNKAESKYGPKWAKAIAATAIVTLPTPFTIGATAAMTGIAHFATRGQRQAQRDAAQAQPAPTKQDAPRFAPLPQPVSGVSKTEHAQLVKKFGLKQADIIAAHASAANPAATPPTPQAAPLRGSPSLSASSMAPGVAGGFDAGGDNADLINTLKDLVKEIKDLKTELGKSDAPGIGKDGSFKPGGPSPMNAHPGASQPSSSTVPRASQGGAGPWMPGVLRALGG